MTTPPVGIDPRKRAAVATALNFLNAQLSDDQIDGIAEALDVHLMFVTEQAPDPFGGPPLEAEVLRPVDVFGGEVLLHYDASGANKRIPYSVADFIRMVANGGFPKYEALRKRVRWTLTPV